MTGEYGITSSKVTEISDYKQVKEKDLLWLMEPGSSKTEFAAAMGAKTQFVNFANVDKVQQLIAKGRNNFYVADKELVDYYLKNKGYASFSEVGLKVHKNCCGGEKPMYMGFSRFSPHYKEKPNPGYDKTKALSPDNFPTVVDPDCVAYKLGKAFKEMSASGETAKIITSIFLNSALTKMVFHL